MSGSKNTESGSSAASRARLTEGPCDIAIIGMACILPKAPNLQAFWANTINRVNAITEIPEDRFDANQYYDTDKKARDKIYSRWGGFIDDVPFDAMRFGIPPNALASIDPMQLLSLVIVDHALRDAGYDQKEIPRERTSVIFGISGGLGKLGVDYAVRATLPQLVEAPPEVYNQLPEWTEDSFAGILPNVATGRVANRFNFSGVNFTVDAACASSLAAVYVAARELVCGTSDVVITGGIDTGQTPFGFLCFSKAQALSPRGACRTFDQSADGIAISEGLTAVVLKRLEDAERDGDRVYAVIKGVAGSSDGRGKSMTAPRKEGQAIALRRAYAQAGISPSAASLLEAHGTGTAAGDSTELDTAAEVLSTAGARPRSCAIGSAKSMVGHTKSAAGLTGLIRVALSLYYKVLPPTLHVEQPNTRLRDPQCPLYLSPIADIWMPEPENRRFAGVSSFGFGGTNFHVVVEEPSGDSAALETRPAELFVWQAQSLEVLGEYLNRTAQVLEAGSRTELREIAAWTCRQFADPSNGIRIAIVAASHEELSAKLDNVRRAVAESRPPASDAARGIYMAHGPVEGKIAFLFPGQGSQSPGMLRDLAVAFPEFRQILGTADRILADRYPRRLSAYIYPPTTFAPSERDEQMRDLTDTVVAQPALGAMGIAVSRLLDRLGARPDMTAGHSYGEYVALCAAGALSEEQLFLLSEARGRAIKDGVPGDPGTMAAVAAGPDAVASALSGRADITLANLNSPRQTIISGATDSVRSAAVELQSAGLTTRMIPVACAFHSPLMEPAREKLAAALDSIEFLRPEVPVYSNTLGDRYPEDPAELAGLLSEHLVRPVRFADEIRAMYDAGARVFIEAGPKGVLSGLARQILESTDARILQVDSSDRHGVVQLLHVLAELAVRGLNLNYQEIFGSRVPVIRDLSQPDSTPPEPAWRVNGNYMHLKGTPRTPVRPITVSTPAQQAAPQPSALASNAIAAPAPPLTIQVETPRASTIGAISQPVADGADAVMAGFQQLMSQFLQTQAAVMTAYLQGTGGSAAPISVPVAVPAAQPVPATIAAPPPVMPAPPDFFAPVEAAPVVPGRISALAPTAIREPALPDAGADLLRIVSERTGYPVEMLDLDAGIESDLGIDSIKRVEILSAFQRSAPESEQQAIQAMMDQLTAARNLREILDRVNAVRGSAQPTPAGRAQFVPATAQAPARDVGAELLQIVSERTGYPVEMLDVDAGIESDLGIDSIKRVEILTAFQRSAPESEQPAIQAMMDQLTAARNLREILDRLAALQNQTPTVASQAASAESAPRFELVVAELPRTTSGRRFYPGRVSIVTDDETGLATALADEWMRNGEKVVLVRHSGEPLLATDGVISADLSDTAACESVVELVRANHGPVGAIVHLLSMRTRTEDFLQGGTLEAWREQIRQEVKGLYALVRAAGGDLTQTGRAGGGLFAVVTGRGGDFGLSAGGGVCPLDWAVADFVKTAATELANIQCKIVDLDRTDPPAVLKAKVIHELSSPDDRMQVGLPGDRRVTAAVRLAPIDKQPVLTIQGDWVFLMTGGARGITAEIAKDLARRFQPVLILTGMSAPPAHDPPDVADISEPAQLKAALAARLRESGGTVKPADVEAAYRRLMKEREIRDTLQAIRQAGARVEYHAVDVRDEPAFSRLIEGIYREHGRLDVVIHGAGIIEDKLIRDKSPESFERVVHTKAESVFLLARHLQPEKLRCLILMSSVTAAFGNRGQADYGAANGILNGAAVALSAWPCHVAAMNWGPWSPAANDSGVGGMVTDEVRQQFLARGIQLIPRAAGVAAILAEIQNGARQPVLTVIGDGPWSQAEVGAPVTPGRSLGVGA